MPRHFTEFVEVHRAPVIADAYTKRRDWGHAVMVWSGWGSAQPHVIWERRHSPARETDQERITVYLPPTADVDSMDRITVDGITYQVDGEPFHWRAGSRVHIDVKAWRVRR